MCDLNNTNQNYIADQKQNLRQPLLPAEIIIWKDHVSRICNITNNCINKSVHDIEASVEFEFTLSMCRCLLIG